MANQKEKSFVQHIASMEDDFSRWYTDVVLQAELMDYAEVRGCMVIRPYGYGIWELIQQQLDERFKATGHKNAYFPLLIPESLLQKEKDHVEGFAPEVAWVTKGGNEELAEPLLIRPTSETIFCSMYAKWIQSYRDLPVLLNQWCNVVRWEKSTRPFLRTSEFLWQEGHTVHATAEEAQIETIQMWKVYQEFMESVLAVPVIAGRKSENEKFAGSEATYTLEAIMQDGKSLQMGTSHNLGQHFAKVFDIQYLDRDGKLQYAWQTSWGVSTRMIGGIIMVHGDQRGLKLPPKVAPIQVIVIPIASHREGVLDCTKELTQRLGKVGIRAEMDSRDQSPGWKFNEWEMRGVPLRVELGPRDVENGVITLCRRDTFEKMTIPMEGAEGELIRLLQEIQGNMFRLAQEKMEGQIKEKDTYQDVAEGVEAGNFVLAPWCAEGSCEEKLKAETSITIRCIPLEKESEAEGKRCAICGKPARTTAYFAKSY